MHKEPASCFGSRYLESLEDVKETLIVVLDPFVLKGLTCFFCFTYQHSTGWESFAPDRY